MAHHPPSARAVAALALALVACDSGGVSYRPPEPFVPAPDVDVARFVDPMIGTDGAGNVVPGALVPHGMVRASPHTERPGGAIDAYDYESTRILGFSHTHLEGPGGSGNGYSQIQLMPHVGPFDPADYGSAFDHAGEVAEPGYYGVDLDDTGVRVELTATAHAALHRYTFPASDDARLVVDLGRSQGRSLGGEVEVVGDREIAGHAVYDVHPVVSFIVNRRAGPTAVAHVYFHVRLDRPFTTTGVFSGDELSPGARVGEGDELGAWVGFATTAGEVVHARVGISFQSAEEARRNADREIGEASFEEVRAAARRAWNDRLGRLRVEGDEHVVRAFTTALYHSMFQPASYTEANGRFAVATSGEVVVRDAGGRPFYTDDWCMWDTYRTSHPLGTLVEPEIRGDIVRSMLVMYEEGGWLPKCTWHASGYSRVMTGNPALPIIADAYVKGLRDFDADLALEAMVKASEEDTDSNVDGLCGYFGLGTPPEYVENGWVGDECDKSQAASMTLEHAYDDFTVARFAEALGREDLRAHYDARAASFRNQWNPETGFFQSRARDGSFVTPFDPADRSDFNGFVEASAWIFSFFVPHDVPALIALEGGDDAFVARLDQFFAEGHFDPSNQPSFHIPWLYDFAGQAHRTQARVHEILTTRYHDGVDGLPGNDDSGSTSAWYVLAALGLYPVAPADPRYHLSTPLVRRAELALHPAHYDGGAFVIEVEGDPLVDPYLQSATLDGVPLERPWITHEEITRGGVLHYVVGPEPSSLWEGAP